MQNHLPKFALIKTSEKFHKFHRKKTLMNSFLSLVVAFQLTEKELHHFRTDLNLVKDESFRRCSRMEGTKRPSL